MQKWTQWLNSVFEDHLLWQKKLLTFQKMISIFKDIGLGEHTFVLTFLNPSIFEPIHFIKMGQISFKPYHF